MHRTASRAVVAALSALLWAFAAGPAAAQFRYDFTAFSSFDFGSPPDQYSGSFSLIVPTFIVPEALFTPAQLLSCSVASLSGTPVTCANQGFRAGIVPDTVTVSFGISTGTSIFYYFQPDAFSAIGTYDTIIFGSTQAGRLVVSAVPEPESAAALALGLATLGGWGVFRRRQARA